MLSQKQKRAYHLYKIQQVPQGEIARIMGIRRENVNRLIARARRERDKLMLACADVSGGRDLAEAMLVPA